MPADFVPQTKAVAGQSDASLGLDESELLQDQVTSTQSKLKVALTRYEELYRFSEGMAKNSERQIKGLGDKIAILEAAVGTADEKNRIEAASFAEKIAGMQQTIEAKEQEIRSLKDREAQFASQSSKLARAIAKNIRSLEDLSGFIESFLKQLDTAQEESLAPKGARIMLEQLRSEIDGLKAFRTHLSSSKSDR
jgi:chromosome segregation ATPase